MMNKYDHPGDWKPRSHITRRQAIKAGGIGALGLTYSEPLIQTLYPKPDFANYVGAPSNGTEEPPSGDQAFWHTVARF